MVTKQPEGSQRPVVLLMSSRMFPSSTLTEYISALNAGSMLHAPVFKSNRYPWLGHLMPTPSNVPRISGAVPLCGQVSLIA